MPSWIETAKVQAMSVVLKGGTLNSNKIVCGILRFKQVQIYLLWLKCGHRNGINRYTPHACSPSPHGVPKESSGLTEQRLFRETSKCFGDPESK